MIGHIIFIGIHILMMINYGTAVLLTIPLHLFYFAITQIYNPIGYKKCNFCKEDILKTATVCPKCTRDQTN